MSYLCQVLPPQSLHPSETSLLQLLLSPPLFLSLQFLQPPRLQLGSLLGVRLRRCIKRLDNSAGSRSGNASGAQNNHGAYLLWVYLSVHCTLSHVVMRGRKGTRIRFLDYLGLLGINVLPKKSCTKVTTTPPELELWYPESCHFSGIIINS